MAKKKFGQYLTGTGNDFKIKRPKSHYGYDYSLSPDLTYVVHIPTRKVVAQYFSADNANAAAEGFDKRDQEILAKEMEKVIRGEDA